MQADSSDSDNQMMSDDSSLQETIGGQTEGNIPSYQTAQTSQTNSVAGSESQDNSATSSSPAQRVSTTSQTQSAGAPSSAQAVSDPFEKFWEELIEGFNTKLSDRPGNEIPWKDKLKEIIGNQVTGNNNWQVTERNWRSCDQPERAKNTEAEAPCGNAKFKVGNKEGWVNVTYTWTGDKHFNGWELKIKNPRNGQVETYKGS